MLEVCGPRAGRYYVQHRQFKKQVGPDFPTREAAENYMRQQRSHLQRSRAERIAKAELHETKVTSATRRISRSTRE